uniref:Uncharacterized protein n=1 Tax=Trichuris muris TaxID=70415 RepID=A0A5S6QG47_TRIMR
MGYTRTGSNPVHSECLCEFLLPVEWVSTAIPLGECTLNYTVDCVHALRCSVWAGSSAVQRFTLQHAALMVVPERIYFKTTGMS